MTPTVEQDAVEYGAHIKHGGWRLGLLVARNVEPGNGQGARVPRLRNDRCKVSAQEFARQSGTSQPRVTRYFEAWQRAAEKGLVPDASTLAPGDDVDLPDDDVTPWDKIYDARDAGGRPRDSKAEDAAIIIKRRGAEAVVAELTEDQKLEIATEVAKASSPATRRAMREATYEADAEESGTERRTEPFSPPSRPNSAFQILAHSSNARYELGKVARLYDDQANDPDPVFRMTPDGQARLGRDLTDLIGAAELLLAVLDGAPADLSGLFSGER